MIKSMTGFGSAAEELNGCTYTVEIKTVNHRNFKLHTKTPESVAHLAEKIEKLLRKYISRGTTNYSLRIHNAAGQLPFEIDEEAVTACLHKIKGIAANTGIDGKIDITNLLVLPGIIRSVTPSENFEEQIKNTVLQLTEKALVQLNSMRDEEGKALEQDLENNCEIIKQNLDIIAEKSPVVVKQYMERLNKRVAELLAGSRVEIDADIIARETAIFAERADIAEEVNRLGSHLGQFDTCCKGGEPAGRRLDFICQEMLRETNTIASKSCDAEIGTCVINIKCAIDRIKEQVQNAE